jgi:hypothetical protein
VNNLVVILDVVSCHVEIAIELEDPCFELSPVPVVKVGLS